MEEAGGSREGGREEGKNKVRIFLEEKGGGGVEGEGGGGELEEVVDEVHGLECGGQ